MSLETLAAKYISMAEKVFSELTRTQTPISLTEDTVAAVLRYAIDYLEDAKYYKAQG